MARIFLSYRREDSGGWAGRLYDRLSRHFGDEHVFMDIDTIEPGLDFVEVIQQAVQSCDVLIALIGRQWLTVAGATGQPRLANPEDFVRLEIATALERNIRVIPVLVQDAPMPRAADLPDDLKRLSRRNAIEIRDTRFHSDVDRLITVLDSVPSSATPQIRERVSPPLQPLAEEHTHTADPHGRAKEQTTYLPHRPPVLDRLRHMIQLWERFHILRHMIQLWERFHIPHPSAMSVRIGLALTVLLVVGGLSIWLVQRNNPAELAQQYNLAEQHYKDENYDQVVQWYRKAAEQGHAGAQYSLGRMYDLGWGVAEDNHQAVQWYRKAAEQGHAGAQYNLGMMYDRGWGMAKDAIQAVQWYRKAAKQGYAMAQDELRRRGLSW
jgi:TIR domain-containing protein/Sel1 repeat-containing protein